MLRTGRRTVFLLSCCVIAGAAAGLAAAIFLWLLEQSIQLHWQHAWLLYLLPLTGLLSGAVYTAVGGRAEGGTELILEELREPAGRIPGRMAPLVLGGTLLTHLCGGSAGREGTAVQMGGSLAAQLARRFGLPMASCGQLISCGMAGGFGAVFGTPLAGAIFAMEVSGVCRGALRSWRTLRLFLLCVLAAFVADWTADFVGAVHSEYRVGISAEVSRVGSSRRAGESDVRSVLADSLWLFVGKAGFAGVAFGLAGWLFTAFRHAVRDCLRRWVAWGWLRPAIGGVLVVLLSWMTAGTEFLGLGVDANPLHPGDVCIRRCLESDGVGWLSWFWKLVFTAVTVGSGFKGGEVTPLFYVGAALGHVLAGLLAMPAGQLAAMGFAAVFAGAARTPLACTVMAFEVFAPTNPELQTPSFFCATAICCLVAAACSGPVSIYGVERGRTRERVNGHPE